LGSQHDERGGQGKTGDGLRRGQQIELKQRLPQFVLCLSAIKPHERGLDMGREKTLFKMHE
jgi:hypothetical protein